VAYANTVCPLESQFKTAYTHRLQKLSSHLTKCHQNLDALCCAPVCR